MESNGILAVCALGESKWRVYNMRRTLHCEEERRSQTERSSLAKQESMMQSTGLPRFARNDVFFALLNMRIGCVGWVIARKNDEAIYNT